MGTSKRIYILITCVFIAGLITIALVPNIAFIQGIAAIPLVGSLVVALFQIVRDVTAHERAILIIDKQNQFVLGASSHMATVAFDKHVTFAEEYVSEMKSALKTLFKDGPADTIFPHTRALYDLRQKHSLWLTLEMDNDLEKFESVLRKIGASATYVAHSPNGEKWQFHFDEMYKRFAAVMGWKEWNGEALSDDNTIAFFISKLRNVLGIEELTRMRGLLISKAARTLKIDE